MYRVVLIGMVLLAVPAMVAAQDKEKPVDKPKTAEAAPLKSETGVHGVQQVSVVERVVQAWEAIAGILGLIFLAMILFQLLMLRSDMERLLKPGGPSSARS